MKKAILLFLIIQMVLYVNSNDRKEISYDHKTVIVNDDSSHIIAEVFISSKIILNELHQSLEYTWYYKNSIKSTTGNFTGHLLDGNYISFDLKGNLLTKGSFVKGLKNGIWYHWSKNGKLKCIQQFKVGILVGNTQLFDSSGTLKSLIKYENGIRTGISRNYSNGHVIAEFKFKNGKIVKEKHYEDGKITKKITYNTYGKIKREKVFRSKKNKKQQKTKEEKIDTKENEL